VSLDIISADDHIIEPPELWADRLPSKYRDAGPRVVWGTSEEGKRYQWWEYEGRQVPASRLNAAAAFTRDQYSFEQLSYEDLVPGCYDPIERVKHMDQDGCLGSLCFPTFPRLCGQTFLEGSDRELGLVCVQAWNDWNLEQWAGAAPGRLIPMSIVPLWDPQLAAAEVRRMAGLGTRAISFSENPNALGQPSIHDPDGYWDPLMQAMVETGLPMCLHIGSSSRMAFERGEVPPEVEVGLAPFNA
jgi:predicted TIM-barrel fold metal-dependent hydrolase